MYSIDIRSANLIGCFVGISASVNKEYLCVYSKFSHFIYEYIRVHRIPRQYENNTPRISIGSDV